MADYRGDTGLWWASLCLAVLLALWPLPVDWAWWRPAWVPLVLIYWAVSRDRPVSLLLMAFLGLLMDGLTLGLFGQQALSFVLMVGICRALWSRWQMFSVIQQVIGVFCLILLHQLILYWCHNLLGIAGPFLPYLQAAVSTALCWPLLRRLLRSWRRRFPDSRPGL